MKKPTVTIAIPAYNEEGNIGKLLRALVLQDTAGLVLEKIIVVSSGSTDNTNRVVRKVKNPLIALIAEKKRRGKSNCLNGIFERTTSDILICFDADVLPIHNQILTQVVEQFKQNKKILVASTKAVPVAAKTMIEAGLNCFYEGYSRIADTYANGQHLFNFSGKCMAFRKSYYHKTRIPINMQFDDAYLYFQAKKMGGEFGFIKNPSVYYRNPQTMHDYLAQMRRYRNTRADLEEFFGSRIVAPEFALAKLFFSRARWYQILHTPVSFIILKFLHITLLLTNKVLEVETPGAWVMSPSSKTI